MPARLPESHRPVQISATHCIRAQEVSVRVAQTSNARRPPSTTTVLRRAVELGLALIEADPSAHFPAEVEVPKLLSPRQIAREAKIRAQVDEANRVWREAQAATPGPMPPPPRPDTTKASQFDAPYDQPGPAPLSNPPGWPGT